MPFYLPGSGGGAPATPGSGLNAAQVQALINAAEADDVDADEVATQIGDALSGYRRRAAIVSTAADRNITLADRGNTIRLTGATPRTFTKSGSVGGGFWVRLLNSATAALTFDVGITDRIEGAGRTLEIPPGTAVTMQFAGAATWVKVTDTAAAAAPGEIADGSLSAAKMDVSDAAKRKAFRAAFRSAHISVAATLPRIDEANLGSDVIILRADVAAGISFVDISDPETALTSAEAGDIIMALMFRTAVWTRVGNILRQPVEPGTPHALVVSPAQINKGALPDKFELNLFVAPGLYTDVTKASVTIGGVTQTIAVVVNQHSTSIPIQVLVTTAMATALDGLADNAVETVIVRLLNASDVQQAEITADLVALAEGSGGGADAPARAAAATAQAAADANTAARWPGSISVVPPTIPHDQGRFTLRVVLHRVDGTWPAGTRMRLNVSGRNGGYVNATDEAVASLAFTAVQSRTLVQNAADGLAGGNPSLRIEDSSGTLLETIQIVLPVTGIGKWRALAGASPYAIRATDDEFEVWITENDVAAEQFGKRISRVMMSAVDRRFPILTNTPKNIPNRAGVTLRLNDAGTQLIASVYKVGGNDAGTWSLTQINAR